LTARARRRWSFRARRGPARKRGLASTIEPNALRKDEIRPSITFHGRVPPTTPVRRTATAIVTLR